MRGRDRQRERKRDRERGRERSLKFWQMSDCDYGKHYFKYNPNLPMVSERPIQIISSVTCLPVCNSNS